MTAAPRESMMPPQSPLDRPIQDLAAPYGGEAAPASQARQSVGLWRLATFLPAISATALLIGSFGRWLGTGGVTLFEALLVALVAVTFFWIALSVSTAAIGIVNLMRAAPPEPRGPAGALDVALLVPIYNEVPWDVFGNAAAMLDELQSSGSAHAFTLFILSDTRDDATAAQEVRAVRELRASLVQGARVYYRRRARNTDRKVGNLSDWVERWGGAYDAMLVLDADSLMAGSAVVALADELSCDPSAGLIQSFPQLFGAQSLFARIQQFSNAVYGGLLAEGLAVWSGREGNYWGHNAIIRTTAFAASSGLPRLRTLRSREALILSHDFVEAGLLRRAGWAVRFLPRIKGSYEETPATLVDHVLRDRRWCQGNLQHLGILTSAGFHPISRFHLLHGAMGYLVSPAWFVLLIFWALLGKGGDASVITYFSDANPLMPVWPEMSRAGSMLILVFMYGMLLAPKFMGASSIHMTGLTLKKLGGLRQFIISFLIEVVFSIAFAPILMVQQMIAVIRTFAGCNEPWVPQHRSGGHYSWAVLMKFHSVETLGGMLLVAGMAGGVVSLWLLPIAISLMVAVPLSALSGVNLRQWHWARSHLGTPEEFDEPEIIRLARARRQWLRSVLEASPSDRIAAE